MSGNCNIIGVDPGATGAIAVLHGNRVTVFVMPTVEIRSGKGLKTRTDIPETVSLSRTLVEVYAPASVRIEQVWGVMGQSASTGAALGHNRGCLETAFAAAGAKLELVSPQRWKGRAGLTQKNREGEARAKTDKEPSRLLALKLWPDDAAYFTPKRGVLTKEQCCGNAEAALIAKFGGDQ